MQAKVSPLVYLGLGVLMLSSLNCAASVATPKRAAVSSGGCLTDDDLNKAVLSLSGDYNEAQKAGHLLRESSKRSSVCREGIIAAVMKAMDKPNLDIRRNQASGDLWREGATLLGDLKAVEALDLLLSHINMDDGEWSMTMAHQPVLEGIIRMGPMAIPKLGLLLRNPDREIRHDAVYCIAWIGGISSRNVLRQALPLEPDPCVRDFIRVSIDTIDTDAGGLKSDKGQWFSAFLCMEHKN